MAAKKKAPGFIPASTPAPSNGESAAGTAYVPDLGPVTRDVPVTRIGACSPFLLKSHPERWTVMRGTVIPCFGKLTIQPGVNGVSDLGGKIRAGDARNMAEEKGWTIIPVDAIPDAHATPGQPKSYLYRPAGRPDVTLLIYERCYPGSDRIDPDEARYVEFCQHLMTTGLVPAPKLYALHKMRERLVRDRDSAADRARENAHYQGALATAQAQLDAVDVAIAARESDAPPVPAARSAAPEIEAEGL